MIQESLRVMIFFGCKRTTIINNVGELLLGMRHLRHAKVPHSGLLARVVTVFFPKNGTDMKCACQLCTKGKHQHGRRVGPDTGKTVGTAKLPTTQSGRRALGKLELF